MAKIDSIRRQKVRNYILDAINLEDRAQYKGLQMSEQDRLRAVYEIFKSEKGWEIERIGQQKTFESWLMGLPSCFNIDFENHRILELSREWGSLRTDGLKPNQVERMESEIIKLWWSRIYMEFRQMLNRKIKTHAN